MEQLHKFIDWVAGILKEVFRWTSHLLADIRDYLCSSFNRFGEVYLSSYLTETSIALFSQCLSLFLTVALGIQLLIWSWRGVGYVFQKLTELVFTRGGEGASWMFKMFFVRIFSSIGYIFSSIANGLKRLLFGSSHPKS